MDANRWTGRYQNPARWAQNAADRTTDAMTRMFRDAFGAEREDAAPAVSVELVSRAG